MSRSALSQLEVEVEKGDQLGARVRELEERVESVQSGVGCRSLEGNVG